ncbi:MAG: pyridoxamine 5'-phosphate oxidase family protein [Gemmatimonadaceae bacterium]|nr:pyridoxamine 5'-phosphate oxidase family protein [Gemmatimonadaceae bacterium]
MEPAALKDEVAQFLNGHRKAVFATVDDDGHPHTSLMLYAVDDAFNVYFGTRRAFRKFEQIMANRNMSLSVIEEVLDPLMAVDIRGTAELLEAEERREWFAYFKSKNPSRYYVEDAEDYEMFRLRPTMIRWLDATSGALTITKFDD